MASPEDSKEKLGHIAATAEKKVSDDTLKKFKAFVLERAGQPEEDETHTQERSDVDSNDLGSIVPVTEIKYDYFVEDDEDPGCFDLEIQAGPNRFSIFEMYTCDDGIRYVMGAGSNVTIEADDALVNNTLTAIEQGEARGAITPVTPQE